MVIFVISRWLKTGVQREYESHKNIIHLQIELGSALFSKSILSVLD